jgi:hypothetical protein
MDKQINRMVKKGIKTIKGVRTNNENEPPDGEKES